MTEIWPYRDLLMQLMRRDVVVRYRHSLLGIGWALLQPLGLMLLFTFVFTPGGLRRRDQQAGCPLSALRLCRRAAVDVLRLRPDRRGQQSLLAPRPRHQDSTSRNRFCRSPRSPSALFDFLVASLVLVGLAAWYHLTSSWKFHCQPALLLLPVILGIQLLFMVGLGPMARPGKSVVPRREVPVHRRDPDVDVPDQRALSAAGEQFGNHRPADHAQSDGADHLRLPRDCHQRANARRTRVVDLHDHRGRADVERMVRVPGPRRAVRGARVNDVGTHRHVVVGFVPRTCRPKWWDRRTIEQ